jgi:hypothetical protein
LSLRVSRTLRTRTRINDLAADAGRAAIVKGRGCGPVAIWSKHGSRTVLGNDSFGCAGIERWSFTFAGSRAAGIDDTEGYDYVLWVAATGSKVAMVDSVNYHYERRDLGHLAGDGDLLVYNTWTWAGRGRSWVRKAGKLWRVDAGGKRQLLRAGADALDVVAVNANRIAVLRRDGRLVILDAKGKRTSAFQLGRRGFQTARLTGHRLVVLRDTTIEVRNARTGALEHRWPTAPSDAPLRLDDAHGNFAVYTAGIAIHLLRLTDGRDRVLAIPNEEEPAHADLEPDGLYYSYSHARGGTRPGRVEFVPLRTLRQQFR